MKRLYRLLTNAHGFRSAVVADPVVLGIVKSIVFYINAMDTIGEGVGDPALTDDRLIVTLLVLVTGAIGRIISDIQNQITSLSVASSSCNCFAGPENSFSPLKALLYG